MKIFGWLSIGLVLLCYSCAGQADLTKRPQAIEEEQELTDRSCAYFYFLWGKSAELENRYEEALHAYEKVLVCDPDTEYVVRDIATLLIKMDKKREAIQWVQKIISRNPLEDENRFLLAKLYAELNDFESAIAVYKSILESEENQQALLMLGTLYAQNRQYEEAQKVLERLVSVNSDSFMGYYYLGRLYRELRLFNKALAAYERALEISWSTRLAFEAAELSEQEKLYEKAAGFYLGILEEDESIEGALTRLINVYLSMDKADLALEKLEELKSLASDPDGINYTISRILISEKRFNEAIPILSEMLAEDDKRYTARYLLALTYHQQGNIEEAKNNLKRIDSSAEEFEESVLLLVGILRKENDVNGAIQILEEKRVNESTRQISFYVVLASLYEELKQTGKAEAIYTAAQSIYPNNIQLLYEYGVFLERIGDQDNALARMHEVLALDPKNAPALNYIGYTWADRGVRLQEALNFIEQAVAIRPDDGYIRDSLGWVLYKMGKTKQAIQALERALQLVEDDAVIYEHMGEVYTSIGDRKSARKAYEKALEHSEDEEKKENIRGKIEKINAGN